ncbi:MAG: TlpA family protein disulfide reductase [Nannocystis sp.]|nr:TlpA disulfide reductase family protein [Nannocystis sp.]MBA3547197.1 TlpA family protein disulfide reductase [Nannocystis sp.]
MTDLLQRIGGVLIAPRAMLGELSPETGRRDGALLLAAYLLAVAVLPIGDTLADFWALRSLTAAPGLLRALLPALPWLLTAAALDWLLGAGRAHRIALCLVPLLVIDAGAHLLTDLGVSLPSPSYAASVLGALAALLLAARVRGAIPITPAASTELSSGTASPAPPAPVPGDMPLKTASGQRRLAQTLGGLILALVAVRGFTDINRLVARWPTLAPVAVGAALPEFAVPLLDGGTLRSADLLARPHLLIFWTTWCGVCKAEMPMYRALADRYAARGLQVIAVNADREGEVAELVRDYRVAHGLPFPIALDDRSMVRRFRVEMFPHLVLIDATGQIRHVHQGRSFERNLAAEIEAVLP